MWHSAPIIAFTGRRTATEFLLIWDQARALGLVHSARASAAWSTSDAGREGDVKVAIGIALLVAGDLLVHFILIVIWRWPQRGVLGRCTRERRIWEASARSQ